MTPSKAKALGNGCAAFWAAFESWLHSQEMLEKMTAKFAAHLPSTYPHRKDSLKKESDGNGGVKVTPRSLLVRDYASMAMAPHTDSGIKFVVGAFYFPKDDSLAEFGTSIYKPKSGTFEDWKSARFDRKDFDLVRTVENAPNSCFVFMKNGQSFHGVEEKAHSDVGRDVLFWTPQIGRKEKSERYLSLPRAVFEPQRRRFMQTALEAVGLTSARA